MTAVFSLRHLVPLSFFITGLIVVGAFYLIGKPATVNAAQSLSRDAAIAEIQSLQGRLNALLSRGALDAVSTDIFFTAADPRVQAVFVVKPDGTVISAHRSKFVGLNISEIAGIAVETDRLADAVESGTATVVTGSENPDIFTAYAGLSLVGEDRRETYFGLVLIEDYSGIIMQMSGIASFSSEVMLVIMMLLSAVLARGLSVRLNTRLMPLINATREIAIGTAGVRLDMPGEDEFSELSRSFNSMAIEIDRSRNELKNTREIAQRTGHLQRQFMKRMNNDIRTPLAGVAGYLDLVSMQNLDTRTAEFVSSASQSARVLMTMIEDILSAARLQSGELSLKPAPFCLNIVMQDVIDNVIQDAKAKNIQLSVQTNESTPTWLDSDKQVVRRIMMVMVRSAIRYTSSGSVTINLDVTPSAGQQLNIMFSVQDTNPFLPEGARVLLSEDGDMTDFAADSYDSGHVGFAVCLDLVKMLGGELDIKERPGEGNTFTVGFSAIKCVEQVADHGLEAIAALETRSLQILCVEADFLGLTLLDNMLTLAGHQPECFADPSAALDAMGQTLIYPNRSPFDLAIIDADVANMSVSDLMGQMRNTDMRYENLPVIVIGTSDEDDSLPYDKRRRNGFVQKPFSTRRLLQEIFAVTRSNKDNDGSRT